MFFVSSVVGFNRSQSQHIAAQASQKFKMCDFVASSQAFVAKAGIDCDHWCPYILRHRALMCVLLTHVWKPGFSYISYNLLVVSVIPFVPTLCV